MKLQFIIKNLNIQQKLDCYVKENNLPFPITFSIGYVRTDMTKDTSLDEYVNEADNNMYQMKTAKKNEPLKFYNLKSGCPIGQPLLK